MRNWNVESLKDLNAEQNLDDTYEELKPPFWQISLARSPNLDDTYEELKRGRSIQMVKNKKI